MDVVELQIYHHSEEAKGLELTRDLKMAISEYAPDSQVVAGEALTSRYIKASDREPISMLTPFVDYCGYYKSQIAEKQKKAE